MRFIALLTAALLLGGAAMAQAITQDEINPPPPEPILKTAIFAGGCFWCMQPAFDATPGVIATMVGYTGGNETTPTYEEVSTGKSGHVEAIEVTYDERRVKYSILLDIFWENIDPLDAGGQFADRGSQYQTAIFVADAEQQAEAQASKERVAARFPGHQVATAIAAAQTFYPAEDYHQKYYQKSAGRYTVYKYGSGRAAKLERLWGDNQKKAE